jgi:hypothetical protein
MTEDLIIGIALTVALVSGAAAFVLIDRQVAASYKMQRQEITMQEVVCYVPSLPTITRGGAETTG